MFWFRDASGWGFTRWTPCWLGGAIGVLVFTGPGLQAAGISTNGPRGKPIRPPAARTNVVDLGVPSVVTLPGGVVITNLPADVLPRTTNIVRLPTRAARKFEPLGYIPTTFTVLSRFFIKEPEPEVASEARWEAVRQQIPEDVMALNGKKVALAGFVLPIAVAEGRATEFLLLRTQGACCFGLVPRVNELVIVKMPAPGIVPNPDTPFVVAGRLQVKWIGEGNKLTAIYELQGERAERAVGY